METIINKLPDDINYMFYIKHKGDKRFSTYNPCKGTMGTGLVFTELYRKEHLLAVCKWIAEDNSGEWIYQLRSGGGKKIYWEHNPMPATPAETPRISTEAAEAVNVSVEGADMAEKAICAFILKAETTLNKIKQKCFNREIYVEDASRYEFMVCMAVSNFVNKHKNSPTQPPQSPETPQDEPRETENKPTVADVAQMVKTELAKNKAMRTAWHLEFPDGTMCDIRHKSTAAGCDFYEYTEVREGEETFKDYKATERDITLYICQLLDLDAPQSPEAL